MKRFLPLLILLLVPLLTAPAYAQAAETDEPSHVTITVVMPESKHEPESEPAPFPALPEFPQPEPPAPMPDIPVLYPTGVHEILENGVRWIVRTYELGAGENPDHIPRGSFERGGWMYSITDITKKETAAAEAKEHTEIITVNTESKEMEAILRQLAPTMEFISEDGFAGVLTLNVSSIAVETAGTRTSGYTASATREYPHLSSNDTSLVPKTITDGGRTLTLATVDWRTNYSATVDYEQIPASYTAVATYTANASRTVVTGYTTTAEYKGEVSRLNQGKTVYTAYFMGTEILPERIPPEIIEPAPEATPEPAPEPLPEPEDEPGAEAEPGGEEEQDAENGSNPLAAIIPAALFALLIGVGAGHYILRIIKNKKGKGDATT
jgi:hypothetical protein